MVYINNSSVNNTNILFRSTLPDSKKVNESNKNVFNDDIFFIGLNPNAKFEVQDLSKKISGQVKFTENNSAENITVNGKSLDILNYVSVTNFTQSLKLDAVDTEKVRKLFSAVVSDNKDLEIGSRENLKSRLEDINLPKEIKDKLYVELSKTGSSFKSKETGTTYNLIFKEDVNKFVDSLSLNQEQTDKLKGVMLSSGQNIRDELATILSNFAKAEHGQQIESRLVISGHSMGVDYFGENNGTLNSSSVQEIAKIMPKAADQIQDLVIAACYAGSKNNLENYKSVFPNLKTFMGYIDSAPGSYSGATSHLRTWEKITRGDGSDISEKLFLGTRKGDHIATWSEKNGYSVDPIIEKEMNARRGFVDVINYIVTIYPKYSEEDTPIKDPSNCDLRDAYSQIQRTLGDPNNTFEDAQKEFLVNMKNMFIRLLYYPKVAENFDNAYKNEINKGYDALNIKAPNFATLSRAESRAEINKLQKNYDEIKDKPELKSKAEIVKNTLDILNDGLILLDSKLIPDNWL